MTDDVATTDAQLPRNRGVVVTALGVLFGDIGTSPLYALRESFGGASAPALDRPDLLGVLSLILWALVLVISVKYLVFVLRADNQGEGGIIALVALLNPWRSKPGEGRYLLMLLAVAVALRFHWHPLLALGAGALFVTIDSAFLGANLAKVPDGGWYALLIAWLVFSLMWSWRPRHRLLPPAGSPGSGTRPAGGLVMQYCPMSGTKSEVS